VRISLRTVPRELSFAWAKTPIILQFRKSRSIMVLTAGFVDQSPSIEMSVCYFPGARNYLSLA